MAYKAPADTTHKGTITLIKTMYDICGSVKILVLDPHCLLGRYLCLESHGRKCSMEERRSRLTTDNGRLQRVFASIKLCLPIC